MKALYLVSNLSGLMTGLKWPDSRQIIPPLSVTVCSTPAKDWDIRFYDRNVSSRQMVIGSGVVISLPCWFRSLTPDSKSCAIGARR